MTVTVLRHHEHRRMPWRNGGGVTSEVARWPADGSDFEWRISFAEVEQSGPFSPFPDVDRVILLVSGPPMLLEFPDRIHALQTFEPFRFRGEDAVHCTVTEPTRDLNVMVRRDRARATVDVLRIEGAAATPAAGVLLVAVLEGTLTAAEAEPSPLEVGDVAMRDDGAPIDLRGAGVVAIIGITLMSA
jgi:environmental stress-induced protein Ves